MYVIKNAIKNIGRNKGRNILTAVIIFAIILTTAISVIINTTTKTIIKDYKSRFGSEVNITFDTGKTIPMSEYKPLTAKQQIAFGESDLLKSKSLSTSLPIIPNGLKSLDDEDEGGGMAVGGGDMQMLTPKAMLVGSSREDISKEFTEGLRKIEKGRMYENKNECLISEQYAELNHLSPGDTIEIKSYFTDKPMAESLTVVGIFSDTTMLGNSNQYKYALANRNNEILVSFETATTLEMFNADPYVQVDAEFVLKDPADIKDFEKEVRAKGLQDYYKVSTDEKSYNKIVGPVEGLAKITNTFLAVVLLLGSAVLILLSVLSIRERKYEIGVLRAMGMKKAKVALGLLTESLVITSICLCLGLGIGAIASQPLADSMLQNQIELAESDTGTYDDGGATSIRDMNSNAKPLSEIDIKLNADAVLRITIISLALACMSSLVGIAYITKYEPMKILSERN